MPLLSSCFCLSLQTSVTVVCKSLMLVVAVTTCINVYHIDYKGAREESTAALGVVALFLTLLTISAFAGHSGAYQSGLWQVVMSLALLNCTIVHWVIVSSISMTEDTQSSWNVCLQNRCPETLWTIDFGYRNSSFGKGNHSAPKENQLETTNDVINFPDDKINFPAPYFLVEVVNIAEADEFTEIEVDEGPKDYNVNGRDVVEEDRKTKRINEKSIDFWEKSIPKEIESTNNISKGVPLIVTIISFLVVFVYFLICTIIICSHSVELYKAYKDELDEE